MSAVLRGAVASTRTMTRLEAEQRAYRVLWSLLEAHASPDRIAAAVTRWTRILGMIR